MMHVVWGLLDAVGWRRPEYGCPNGPTWQPRSASLEVHHLGGDVLDVLLLEDLLFLLGFQKWTLFLRVHFSGSPSPKTNSSGGSHEGRVVERVDRVQTLVDRVLFCVGGFVWVMCSNSPGLFPTALDSLGRRPRRSPHPQAPSAVSRSCGLRGTENKKSIMTWMHSGGQPGRKFFFLFLTDSAVVPFLKVKSALELAQNKQNFLRILDAKRCCGSFFEGKICSGTCPKLAKFPTNFGRGLFAFKTSHSDCKG